VLAALDEQLTSTTKNLDKVGRGLIDYFFLRLFQALAAVGLFVLLLVVLVLFVLRRRRNQD
jgi:LPXTG-motif cell wall-anchored protein